MLVLIESLFSSFSERVAREGERYLAKFVGEICGCGYVRAEYMVDNDWRLKMATVKHYARMRKFEAGEVMRVNIYPVRNVARGRKPKMQASRACQAALNKRNSRKRFQDIAHLNFNKREGGYRVLLDYNFFIEQFGRNPNAEEYKAYLAAYFRKLRALYAAHGAELKYMYCTHVGRRAGKVHHHCLISTPPSEIYEEVIALWQAMGLGYSSYDPLYFRNGSIAGLMNYFFDGTVDQRWSCSKNCKRPSVEAYEDGTPASVSYEDRAITMSQAHYMDKHREDIAYIERLFPGYAVSHVVPKAEAIGVSGTEYNLLPFDGPFVEIELYKLSASDKRIKVRSKRTIRPRLKV